MNVRLNIDFCLNEITPEKQELFQAVFDAHDSAARKNHNASSGAALNSFFGSGHLTNAIASAILSVGNNHGPINEARVVYENFDENYFKHSVKLGNKIAGFGNSFFKDKIDPSWSNVDELIRSKFSKAASRIDELHKWMKECGKSVHPNAALYTAVLCNEIGLIHGLESVLFILSRTSAWASMCIQNER
jgi:citrate synthase